jgi:hypothetical protein
LIRLGQAHRLTQAALVGLLVEDVTAARYTPV